LFIIKTHTNFLLKIDGLLNLLFNINKTKFSEEKLLIKGDKKVSYYQMRR